MPVLLVASLCLLVVLVFIVALLSYGLAWRVTRPGRHTYWDEYTFHPTDMGVPYETVSFLSPDGLRLVAWLMKQPDSGITVVLGSGYRDRKTSLLPVAAGLWRQGLNVFLLDFRNQGDSQMDDAQTMGWREIQDMLAAVSEVESRLPGCKIAAMGWSMGAVVSIFAAARDRRIAAVVADSAYADQAEVIAFNFSQVTHLPAIPFVPLAETFFQWRAGYRPSQVRPEDVIADIAPRPILIIHGMQDDMCPVGHAHRLYARAGEPKELWLTPDTKHVGSYFADPDVYIKRVARFLHDYLD